MAGTKHKYHDLLALHRPQSSQPKMSMHQRAAQFAPFAALSGHADAVAETGRFTEQKKELQEFEQTELDLRLQQLLANHTKQARFIVFVPDTKKEGGTYETHVGTIRTYDEIQRKLILHNGTQLPLEHLMDIIFVDLPPASQDVTTDH